jgi:hypothetical protein
MLIEIVIANLKLLSAPSAKALQTTFADAAHLHLFLPSSYNSCYRLLHLILLFGPKSPSRLSGSMSNAKSAVSFDEIIQAGKPVPPPMTRFSF